VRLHLLIEGGHGRGALRPVELGEERLGQEAHRLVGVDGVGEPLPPARMRAGVGRSTRRASSRAPAEDLVRRQTEELGAGVEGVGDHLHEVRVGVEVHEGPQEAAALSPP
jgi:hypothetical protein